MQSVGVIALLFSVLTMVASFIVGFGDIQMALATLSLASITIAATILLRDPDLNERTGQQKSLRNFAEALFVRFGFNR